ncbi:Protein HHL1, chloroplastic [Porphyridium purpureum]|uniref:Protein HHL1, chloroplastic n=1 Tax=Porphyridium purpureum TaxID=35688 RepID=A0A5J4Z721_PORPP|nr:Protein HHL1, chloroplastic [Porphyridium purpureum]|eukprot:POR1201..scf295_1
MRVGKTRHPFNEGGDEMDAAFVQVALPFEGAVRQKRTVGVVRQQQLLHQQYLRQQKSSVLRMAKGSGRASRDRLPQGGPPELPKDGTPVFAIFARTQRAKIWYPVGMVGGDRNSKTLVNAMKANWSRKLYQGALDKGIAQVVFGPDSRKFLAGAMNKYPQLSKYRDELEFGYKVISTEIRDWPTTIVTPEAALPFFEWVKYKLGMRKQA